MSVLVGTSGWSYPTGKGTWNGVFYPPRRPKGFDELAYYAEHFDTVEVNSTFYRTPDSATVHGWLRRTPARFQFSVKLFQKFTHPDMYLERHRVADWDVTRGDLDVFRTGIAPLAESGRLAALLVQFPPSFHAETHTRGYLEWLLEMLRDLPLAVELRHRSWSDDEVGTQALLDTARAAWVLIDEPRFASSIRQRLSPDDAGDASATAPLAYIRLHGRNAAEWWTHEHAEDRYNYLYSAAELRPFADAARHAGRMGRRVLMYMNNHFSAKAVVNAAELRRQLGDLVPGDYPREMVDRYPELREIVRTTGLPL